MRRNRGYQRTAAVMLTAAMLLTGCGSSVKDSAALDTVSHSEANESYAAASEAQAAGGTSYSYASSDMAEEGWEGERSAEGELLNDRKLIKTVELEMETKEFDLMMSQLEAQIQALGGYIENLETYNGSSYSGYRSSRWANLTIRIPKDVLNSLLESMSEIGNVIRRSDSVEDVTLSYVDMESRRDTLRAEQARLLEFMEQAEDVEDMIALEERLSEVRYRLESMESQLRTIDNQVDYSTVYLNISEVKELTPVEEKSDLQRIGEGFSDSLKNIGNSIKEAFIWFVIHIPYLVIWAAVIAAFAAAIKKCRKKKAAGKAAKLENAKREAEQSHTK